MAYVFFFLIFYVELQLISQMYIVIPKFVIHLAVNFFISRHISLVQFSLSCVLVETSLVCWGSVVLACANPNINICVTLSLCSLILHVFYFSSSEYFHLCNNRLL